MNLSFLDRLQPLGLLVLRVVLGVIMVAHGYPKVFGGLQNHLQSVGNIGLPPWMGYLSSFTELVGGVLIMAGLLTRPVAVAMFIEMVVVIAKIHWKNGLKAPGGYEFAMACGAIAFSLIWFGAGMFSLDALLGKGKRR